MLFVLFLAGIESIFFIIAHMVTCFGFVTQTLLISIKAFSVSHRAPPAIGLGVHTELGGDTVGTADPNRPKGYSILSDVGLSNKSCGGEIRRKCGCSE